jgi:diadenylate cyclase
VSIREFVELLTWNDFVDVALVTILLYNVLLLIRGTRAVQMLLGLLLVFGVYQGAKLARFRTLEAIIESFFLFLPFAVIVLFQDQIRRALANMGRNPLGGLSDRERVDPAIGEVALAAATLASRRIGALIVFERQEGLRNYIEGGIRLDAMVSYDLLLNLFTPDTPLHDGAVILQGDRIAAAACFLPLSSDPELSREVGSRHRAALGISEETDAVAVVVSEESGKLALAVRGRLEIDLDSKSLRAALHRLLVAEGDEPQSAPEGG